jgi:hypothetical protein
MASRMALVIVVVCAVLLSCGPVSEAVAQTIDNTSLFDQVVRTLPNADAAEAPAVPMQTWSGCASWPEGRFDYFDDSVLIALVFAGDVRPARIEEGGCVGEGDRGDVPGAVAIIRDS